MSCHGNCSFQTLSCEGVVAMQKCCLDFIIFNQCMNELKHQYFPHQLPCNSELYSALLSIASSSLHFSFATSWMTNSASNSQSLLMFICQVIGCSSSHSLALVTDYLFGFGWILIWLSKLYASHHLMISCARSALRGLQSPTFIRDDHGGFSESNKGAQALSLKPTLIATNDLNAEFMVW